MDIIFCYNEQKNHGSKKICFFSPFQYVPSNAFCTALIIISASINMTQLNYIFSNNAITVNNKNASDLKNTYYSKIFA